MKFIIENDIPRNAYNMGQYLVDRLKRLAAKNIGIITEIRGKGLLQAVQFSRDIAKKLAQECLNNGLLVNDVKLNALRLMPALTVSPAEIDEAVDLLEISLSGCWSGDLGK